MPRTLYIQFQKQFDKILLFFYTVKTYLVVATKTYMNNKNSDGNHLNVIGLLLFFAARHIHITLGKKRYLYEGVGCHLGKGGITGRITYSSGSTRLAATNVNGNPYLLLHFSNSVTKTEGCPLNRY